MEKFKVSIGDNFRKNNFIIEAAGITSAIAQSLSNYKMMSNSRKVNRLEITQLFCPCPHCSCEQVEGIGCPNLACSGRSK